MDVITLKSQEKQLDSSSNDTINNDVILTQGKKH